MRHVERVITVAQPRDVLYDAWRDFEHLPRFITRLSSVVQTGDHRWHWVARDESTAWEMELLVDRPGVELVWQCIAHEQVNGVTTVTFHDAPGDRGTEVRVAHDYEPRAGVLGALVGRLFGDDAEQEIREDLRHFKQLMEAGEIPTTAGQPSGRTS